MDGGRGGGGAGAGEQQYPPLLRACAENDIVKVNKFISKQQMM